MSSANPGSETGRLDESESDHACDKRKKRQGRGSEDDSARRVLFHLPARERGGVRKIGRTRARLRWTGFGFLYPRQRLDGAGDFTFIGSLDFAEANPIA